MLKLTFYFVVKAVCCNDVSNKMKDNNLIEYFLGIRNILYEWLSMYCDILKPTKKILDSKYKILDPIPMTSQWSPK